MATNKTSHRYLSIKIKVVVVVVTVVVTEVLSSSTAAFCCGVLENFTMCNNLYGLRTFYFCFYFTGTNFDIISQRYVNTKTTMPEQMCKKRH